jgi:hypothetical protein
MDHDWLFPNPYLYLLSFPDVIRRFITFTFEVTSLSKINTQWNLSNFTLLYFSKNSRSACAVHSIPAQLESLICNAMLLMSVCLRLRGADCQLLRYLQRTYFTGLFWYRVISSRKKLYKKIQKNTESRARFMEKSLQLCNKQSKLYFRRLRKYCFIVEEA